MINHSNCDHPRDRAGRAACRRAQGGKVTPAGTRQVRSTPPAAPSPYTSLEDANAPLVTHMDTIDDRIRSLKSRPKAGPVKVTKVDPESLTG